MKRPVSMILIAALLVTSCNSDVILSTGNITVTSSGDTLGGTPIDMFSVGLFDINVLVTEQFLSDEAISQKFFNKGKVKFNGLNPGNYVVVLMSQTGIRKTVQVTSDKTVTIDLLN